MPRVVAIADSDSYLKWSAATLAAMPADWDRTQWLIKNPVQPSADQVQAATDATVDRVGLAQLMIRLRRESPDVILLATTGPVAQSILNAGFLRRAGRRPVLVTGLPGISIPATPRAIEFRSGSDVFIVHSHREVEEFSALAEQRGISMGFVLARLPFIGQTRKHQAHNAAQAPEPVEGLVPEPVEGPIPEPVEGPVPEPVEGPPTPIKIIFAAQAKVPEELTDRQHLLRAFANLPDDRRVVIKLRALPGEQQTHRERLPYPELWADLVRTEGLDPDRVEFAGGSMADALADAAGFVTVSSTAALEAIGLGVPILVLSDFGVSAEAINEVFIGSGCLGTLADLSGSQLRRPQAEWLRRNYFHPAQDSDWVGRITDLLRQRDRTGLPARTPVNVDGRRRLIRRQLRLTLPVGVLRTSGRLMRRQRRLRRRLASRH